MMRAFKDVACPVCQKDFTVAFNDKEQGNKGKYSKCRNQVCRLMLWIPMIGDAKIVKFQIMSWPQSS